MDAIYESVVARDPNQPEFHQTVSEVLETLKPVIAKMPEYLDVVKRIVEPERQIVFRVPWRDDKGELQVNRGFRVQFNSALGPYKGGLRFHPSVNLSIVKFLGFEQVFKNSLTTLPMGGGKGGSDFDPKGKSDAEVESFCQSFMQELYRHIGASTDVPAGDIGVGGREIGYMYAQYKKLTSLPGGILTGKGMSYGGSNIRPEATGYGVVYYMDELLKHNNQTIKGKTVIISGSGNVAQYALEKCLDLGAKVLTLSDSKGYVHKAEGFNRDDLKALLKLKNVTRGRVSEMAGDGVVFVAGKRPWEVKADLALPCATQNEVEIGDAKTLVANGCLALAEGSNMSSTNEAVALMHDSGILYGCAKAANAGGVLVSGLEMSQNAQRLLWTREEVDNKLHTIMKELFSNGVKAAEEFDCKTKTGKLNYLAGSNIAGFLKVADAMKAGGIWG